ncbi:MAG: hypothetical protein DDT19_00090 [Syntrophomonadaceae bacterium]|nr:hypothetical protein [Bacillota bacterium]
MAKTCPTCKQEFGPESPDQKLCPVDSIRYTPEDFLDRYYRNWREIREWKEQKVFKVEKR